MRSLGRFQSCGLRGVGIVALAVSLCACGGQVNVSAPPRIAVLSTFPAEMAPLLAQATVNDTMTINGRIFRIGMLGGARVVLGLTGIGLVNAATTTRAVLEQFEVTGVVVSAVAGSTLQIADVTVPATWEFTDGTSYAATPAWLDLAKKMAASGTVLLDNCTERPAAPTLAPVCVTQSLAIAVGGVGQTTDPYGGHALPCQETGNDVFGCDATADNIATTSTVTGSAVATLATFDATALAATDNETAAIAREAAARGLPFIAFRAVSDGTGDPLGLPGYPSQFFVYYRLAAHNAAATAVAFLERLAAGR
jgi:nucleoside phosphorylase